MPPEILNAQPDPVNHSASRAGMALPLEGRAVVLQAKLSMLQNPTFKSASVIGPLGEPLTLDSLPKPSTTRWVIRRKAEVVAAVHGGLLSADEACARYGLAIEELAAWQRAIERSGMAGLRVTRVQHYRNLYERQMRY